MAETTKQDEATGASAGQEGGQESGPSGSATYPRIWPAVLIVAAHLAFSLGTFVLASTNTQYVVGFAAVPLLATLLLIIWWMTASGVPVRERLIGLALFGAAILCIVFTQKSNGVFLLIAALPTVTTGVVGLLLVTPWLRWPLRRWAAAAVMVGCAGVFTGIRVDALDGNLLPILSWRWSPTSEDLLAASTPLRQTESQDVPVFPLEPGPNDWQGFRGPARDGRVAETSFSADWANDPPREVWRRRVGLGWSSFAVIGDYVFTQEQRGTDELVVCYHAETGDEVWVNRIPARFDEAMGSGPRATPEFHQKNLYSLGATGVLQCMQASTGNTIWKRDLIEDTGAKLPTWGFSSSPLIAGDLVIVFTGASNGKSVVAYNKTSGDLAWSAGEGSHGYSSAHLAPIDGVLQVLMASNFGLQSFAPETGTVLWEHPWDLSGNPRVVQPLVADDGSVMIGTSFGKGTRRLRVQKAESSWNIEEQWTTKRFRPYFNDSVYHKGYCYGFDGNRVVCIDAATGARRWKGERYGGQMLLISDMDMLLVLSEKGDVVLIQAVPEEYNEIAQFKALNGKTWNHPVVAQGKLFVRNSEEAACFEWPT